MITHLITHIIVTDICSKLITVYNSMLSMQSAVVKYQYNIVAMSRWKIG